MVSQFTDTELAFMAILLDEEENEEFCPPAKKKKWVHDAWTKRDSVGEFATLFKELQADKTMFQLYFRMSLNCFEYLLGKLKIYLKKKDTKFRMAISPRQRLAVCLRYLATGDSFKTISFSYRLGQSTVRKIVRETCKVIVEKLMPEAIPQPSEQIWKNTASGFFHKWNFPNCLGALDGKHVQIQKPANSGSLFYNYKKTFSIVLLALVDADYNFIAVDVGAQGRKSDGGIFSSSNLGKALENQNLSVPFDCALPGTDINAPHVIVGDEAFPLKSYLMRPYPGNDLNVHKKIFNYRLSRARRVSENAFGILTQTFRIYNRRIQGKPENIDNIILATCTLHNFIRNYDEIRNVSNIEGLSKHQSLDLQHLPEGGNPTQGAFRVRDIYKNYFNSDPGSVSWQNEMI